MHVIDDYLAAHQRYVEALEQLDSIGSLLRDVGEQLLSDPRYVHFERDGVWLERRVNGAGGGPEARSIWPTPDRIKKLVDDFTAAKAALVRESDVLVGARAPESIKKAVAGSREG